MSDLLGELLPRLVPELRFVCLTHQGKTDLKKSVVQKLRSWRAPRARFVIMRDQDNGDCHVIKASLNELCARGGRPDSLTRVICRELEAWYVGDVSALMEAFPESARRIRTGLAKRRFRDPDRVVQPAKVLAELIPAFQKRNAARAMGRLLSRDNASHSFQVFMAGIERLQAEDTNL